MRPGCPRIPAPPGAGSVQLGGDGEGKAQTLQRRQDQGPGCPTCLFLSPESSLVYPVGGRGRIQKLSHMPFHSPHHPLLVPGTLSSPLLRCIWPCPGRTEACCGARAAGVTCWESFQLLGAIPHPQGWASGCGQLGAPRLPLLPLPRRPLLLQLPQQRLRSRPSPRLARPTPGPHWQPESPPLRVFPKAPSSRARARAAPPAPLPALGCRGSRDPLNRGARTFRGVQAGRPPAPSLPARSPAFLKGASPSSLSLSHSRTGSRWVIVFFSVSLKSVK